MSSKRTRSQGRKRPGKKQRQTRLLEMLPSEVAKFLDFRTMNALCQSSASVRKLYLLFRCLLRQGWRNSTKNICHDTIQVETSAAFQFDSMSNTVELQTFPRLKELKLIVDVGFKLLAKAEFTLNVEHLPRSLQVLKMECKSGTYPIFSTLLSNWPPFLQHIEIVTQACLRKNQYFNVRWPSALNFLKIEYNGMVSQEHKFHLHSSSLPASLTHLEFFDKFTFNSQLPNLTDLKVAYLIGNHPFPSCLQKLCVEHLLGASTKFRLPPTLEFFCGNPHEFISVGFSDCIIQHLRCDREILIPMNFTNVQSSIRILDAQGLQQGLFTFSSSLKSLQIPNEYLITNNTVSQLPVGLTSLQVGEVYFECGLEKTGLTKLVLLDLLFIGNFSLSRYSPSTLQELVLIEYNEPLTHRDQFPPNLKSLTLVDFNHPIQYIVGDIFPPKLERLMLVCFDNSLHWKSFPRSLIHFDMRRCTKDILGKKDDIPPLLQSCFRPYVLNQSKLPYHVSEKSFFPVPYPYEKQHFLNSA